MAGRTKKDFRNSFNSGVLDPKLAARADLEQWQSALRTGTNVLLSPHGGARRRPGTRHLNSVTEQGRLAAFRFKTSDQYLLHFRNLILDIYEDEVLITQVTAPWATADLARLDTRAQTADTMVLCHQDYPPHRILRGALAEDPIRTDSATNSGGNTTVTVEHPDHDLLDGDNIGISGVDAAVDGVTAAVLNAKHSVTLIDGENGTGPVSTTNGSSTVRVIVPNHTLVVGERITFADLASANDIPASELNTTRIIDAVGGTGATAWVEFEAESQAGSTGSGAGGNVGLWRATDLYQITVVGSASSAYLAVTGGGSDCRAWVLHSLAPNLTGTLAADPVTTFASTTVRVAITQPNLKVGQRIDLAGLTETGTIPAGQLNKAQVITAVSAGAWIEFTVGPTGSADTGGGSSGTWSVENVDRKVRLDDLPQFDFEDVLSPSPSSEVQRLEFDDFAQGDRYVLIVPIPNRLQTSGGYKNASTNNVRTPFLVWEDTEAINADIMQQAIIDGLPSDEPFVTVEYDTAASSGSHHEYIFRFDGAVDFDPIQVYRINSISGTITPSTDVEGGSTEEDVISDVRGWPGGALFYQRRLWFYRLLGRPSSILASEVERFFNFSVGSGLDAEAIDATGEFDPIQHLLGKRGLYALTARGEAPLTGGADDAAITPSNITLKVENEYGATLVPPVTLGGRPMYVDRIGRNIRQLGYTEASGATESVEVSIMSQHLIKTPVRMAAWRNDDADYLFVVNTDGTIAALSMNQEQGVAGWTEITTTGSFLDVVEVDDTMYAIVSRDIDGTPTTFLEVFDYDSYTDCGERKTGSAASSWTGFDHLDGEELAVRGDEITMEAFTAASGTVQTLSGDAPVEVTAMEAGLAMPVPTVEPVPGQQHKYSAVIGTSVDFYNTRGAYINGFKVRPYLPHEPIGTDASPLITGFRDAQTRGYGDRESVLITSPEPQPFHVRAVVTEAM